MEKHLDAAHDRSVDRSVGVDIQRVSDYISQRYVADDFGRRASSSSWGKTRQCIECLESNR